MSDFKISSNRKIKSFILQVQIRTQTPSPWWEVETSQAYFIAPQDMIASDQGQIYRLEGRALKIFLTKNKKSVISGFRSHIP